MMTRRAAVWTVMSWVAVAPPLVYGQTTEQKTAADALFDEGKALIAAGDVAGGCAKLEKSQRIVVKLGVKLNLADCYERLGRTASAWTEFREAASLAEQKGDNRHAFARERMQALEPKLIRLAIVAPDPSPRGMKVTRGGQAVPPELYGVATPIDPGTYKLEASAPGHTSWSQEIAVGENERSTTVKAEVSLVPIEGYEPPEGKRPMPVWLPWTVAGGGVVVGIVGTVLLSKGISDRNKYDEIYDMCVTPTPEQCSQLRLNEHLLSRSKTEKAVGAIGLVLGGGALATGIVLLVLNKPHTSESVALGVWSNGLYVRGQF